MHNIHSLKTFEFCQKNWERGGNTSEHMDGKKTKSDELTVISVLKVSHVAREKLAKNAKKSSRRMGGEWIETSGECEAA